MWRRSYIASPSRRRGKERPKRWSRFCLCLVHLKHDEGALGEALNAGLEATELLDRFAVSNVALRLRCTVAVANIRALAGGTRGIDELRVAYSYAQNQALPRAAANIAVDLCGAYKTRGESDRALHFGSAAMTLAQSVCSNEEFVLNSTEVAHTYLTQGHLRSARSLLFNARATIRDSDVYLSAVTSLLDADIHLAEGRFVNALMIARTTANAMKRLGLERFLGSALRIEAQAQEALGHHRDAIRDIDESLTILQSSGHPYVLAGAYKCSASICGQRAHRLAADDLMRMLRA